MKRLVFSLTAALAAPACGSPSGPRLDITLPSVLPVNFDACAAPPSDFADRLTAELRIGGHAACELDVNPTDGTVSGECPQITAGITRPIVLVWSLTPLPATPPEVTPPVIQLSYHVSYVELGNDTVADAEGDIDVGFDDNSTSRILWRPDQLVPIVPSIELPFGSPDCVGAECLEVALSWAKEEAVKQRDPDPLLDIDEDGCSNLSEACQGGEALLYENPFVPNDPSPTCFEDCPPADTFCQMNCCAYP